MTLTTSDDMLHELTMQYTNICHYTSELRINHGQDNNSQVLHILTGYSTTDNFVSFSVSNTRILF